MAVLVNFVFRFALDAVGRGGYLAVRIRALRKVKIPSTLTGGLFEGYEPKLLAKQLGALAEVVWCLLL